MRMNKPCHSPKLETAHKQLAAKCVQQKLTAHLAI